MGPASEFRTRVIGLSIHDAWYVSHRVDYHCRDSFVSYACSQSRDLLLFFASTGTSFALACIPLHILYYLYSGFTYLYIRTGFLLRRIAVL